MMGKRVNYACRSVISPDPYIGTTEIGIPLKFAKVLTQPMYVFPENFEEMKQLVINGGNEYPGANFLEDQHGKLFDLERMPLKLRKYKADKLLSIPGQRVWRHMKDKDVMLVNRQPTLHKPGIMAHHVRVLKNPNYQTIRMHYANCNTYNADFDGDEINCHFPQNEIARAEANEIAFTDRQYIVPTDGSPLRGLIQDSVDSGVKLCSKNIWLTKEDFQQLTYQALGGLPGLEISSSKVSIEMPKPAILKPKTLWSGKQVFSCILRHLTPGLPQLNLLSKTKMSASAYGDEAQEHIVVIREGELLQGVLDKAAFGATKGGLVHSVHEIYGPTAAGNLLTAIGRVLVSFLQFAGHTCGIEDLTLMTKADNMRQKLIKNSTHIGQKSMVEFLKKNGLQIPNTDCDIFDDETIEKIREKTKVYLSGSEIAIKTEKLDRFMMSNLADSASEIIKVCIPDGLEKTFPQNNFSLMVNTGAKGSHVNQSQISCALGQQALEGRRVPVMCSGKSLPSFLAFDPNPRANGFITDRFLTGIRPQDYYFHCMAGREGLVDTAVKTARSGYLQRCLVKSLEELHVAYDGTVRDCEGAIYQFLYGEDGIDTVQTSFLSGNENDMNFIAENIRGVCKKYSLDKNFFRKTGLSPKKAFKAFEEQEKSMFDEKKGYKVGQLVKAKCLKNDKLNWESSNLMPSWHLATIIKLKKGEQNMEKTCTLQYMEDKRILRNVPFKVSAPDSIKAIENMKKVGSEFMEVIKPHVPDPVQTKLNVMADFGATSELFQNKLNKYVKTIPENFPFHEKLFTFAMWTKYMRSLANPGENVGSIASQSVGAPSTQMTLNTFHLAGHGGANVTLGIPRLREILMMAPRNLKTPLITVPLKRNVSREKGEKLSRMLTRINLSELISNAEGGITVRESLKEGNSGIWIRKYTIRLKIFPEKMIKKGFGKTFKQVAKSVASKYAKVLENAIQKTLRQSGATTSMIRDKNSSNIIAEETDSLANDDDFTASELSDNESISSKSTINKVSENLKRMKAARREEEEFEANDSDNEEGQGTLRFGRKEELASYGEMDEDEAALWESMSGNTSTNNFFSSDDAESENEETEEVTEHLFHSKFKSTMLSSIKAFNRQNVLEMVIEVPASLQRLLMVDIALQASESTVAMAHGNINQAFIVQELIFGENRLALQAEGVAFETLHALDYNMIDLLDLRYLSSNHIWGMRVYYGVEACRASIPREIAKVFGVYGIVVDPRHLGLIADFMTYNGGYRPLNRMGMIDSHSPCLQMSFERTMDFLVRAAMNNKVDSLTNPSGRIVMGQVGKFGTGHFDLFMPLDKLY